MRINPFTDEAFEFNLRKARSLDKIVKDVCRKVQKYPSVPKAAILYHLIEHCEVNTDVIDKKNWHCIDIKQKTIIRIVLLPKGGGNEGKNPLATVLSLVVGVIASVASFGIMGVVGGALGYAVSAAVGTAVSLAGTLAINAIFPAQTPKDPVRYDLQKDSERYLLTGGRNNLSPYGSIPVVLGKVRVTPFYISKPYTEASLDKNYLSCSFLWGYADFRNMLITDMMIGNNPLSNYNPTEFSTKFDNTPKEGDTVTQYDVGLELTIESEIIRTVRETSYLIVDIAFPSGLYGIGANGQKISSTAQIGISYRKTGTSTWYDVGGSRTHISSFRENISDFGASPVLLWNVIVRGTVAGDEITNQKIMMVRGDWPLQSKDIQLFLVNRSGELITDFRPDKTQFNYNVTHEAYQNSWTGGVAYATYLNVSGGYLSVTSVTITENKTSIVTRTYRHYMGSPADYEIKLKKLYFAQPAGTFIDRCVWLNYKTQVSGVPFSYKYPLASSRLYLQASDNLNGVIDTFSAICTSVVYDYKGYGGVWQARATNNPASLILYVLTGNPNARRLKFNPSNNVNLDWVSIDKLSFQEFHDWCRLNKYTYNKYLTEAVGVWDLIQEIAATARSFVTLVEGKWTIKTDKIQNTPKYIITPYNSWGATTQRALPDIPHALRLSFANECKNYRVDERIVYSDGYTQYNSELFQQETVEGITHPDQIYRYGREMLKASIARIETHTVSMDWESVVIGLRDRVYFSYDYLMNSLSGGRIKELAVENGLVMGVLTDNYFIMEPDKSYGVLIRRPNNIVLTVAVNKNLDSSDYFTFQTAQSLAAGIDVGQLFLFGEINKMASDCIVAKIEREDDFVAKLTLIDYAPSIYEDPSKPVPPFDSNIQDVSPDVKVPTPPVGLVASVTYVDTSLGREYTVSLTYNPPMNSPVPVKDYEIWYCKHDQSWTLKGSTKDLFIYFDGVATEYTGFKVRAIGINNVYSLFTELLNPSMGGVMLMPSDVQQPLSMVYIDNRLYIVWVPVFDKRPLFYEIRRGGSWNSGQIMVSTADVRYQITMEGTYWIKAKVFGGYESVNATSIEIESLEGLKDNIISDIEESPVWEGVKVNFEKKPFGTLEADTDFAEYTIYGENRVHTKSALPVQIDLSYKAEAYIDYDLFSVSDIFAMKDVFGKIEEAFIATTYIQLKRGDVWREWIRFVPGQYIGQAFNFKIQLTRVIPNTYLRLYNFRVIIDVPDRIESFNDILVPPAGTLIKYRHEFNNVPTWQGSILNASGNEDIEILKENVTAKNIFVRVKRGIEYVQAQVNLLIQGY